MNDHIEELKKRGMITSLARVPAAQTDSPAQAEELLAEEGRAITAVQVTLFGRECFLPADIAQEVEQACAAREQEQSHEP